MYYAINFNVDWLKVKLPFKCAIHFAYPREIIYGCYNVLLIATEPEDIRISEHDLEQCHRDFDLVITHDDRHCKYPNHAKFIFWDTQVNTLPETKIFSVSTIFSLGAGSSKMSGYQARFNLYAQRDQFKIQTNFYISSRLANYQAYNLPTLNNDKKDQMFESMFHICIENEIESNYFSEKLLDCFNTYTVPIYRGCRNTDSHGIVEDSIIRFDRIDECIDICNNLTLDDYYSRLTSISHNKSLRESKGNVLDSIAALIIKNYKII